MRLRRTHVLALVPVVALVGAPWFANRVEPMVLGMPFLLAWIVFWIVMTSVIMWLVGRLDERAE